MTTLVLMLLLINGLIYGAKRAAAAPGFRGALVRGVGPTGNPGLYGGRRHSPRYLTAMRLNHGLRGTPMRHLGFELEAAGWRYHVSPYLMAAIAATESSLGRAACWNNQRNVWGLASCNQSWHVPTWRSWHEAIFWYARFLKSHWPRARTAYEFYGYAACSSCWGARTAYFMRALFGVGPGVRYP